MKEFYTKWSDRTFPLQEKGVLVASDSTQEWLLPWWFENYQKHNDLPVCFVDFGLSAPMKAWCKSKGDYIYLEVPDVFVAEKKVCTESDILLWEEGYGKSFWESRNAWFKKPLACLQSCYQKTLWVDSDCEIRGSLKPLFSMEIPFSGMMVNQDLEVNSGVILFVYRSCLIEKWARLSLENNKHYRGDQDILADLLKKQEAANLPLIYNHSRLLEDVPNVVVKHWHGANGKTVIAHQIHKKNLEIFDFSN